MASKKKKSEEVSKSVGDEPKKGKKRQEKKAKEVLAVDPKTLLPSLTRENKALTAQQRKLRPDQLAEEFFALKAEVELLRLVVEQVLAFLKK